MVSFVGDCVLREVVIILDLKHRLEVKRWDGMRFGAKLLCTSLP